MDWPFHPAWPRLSSAALPLRAMPYSHATCLPHSYCCTRRRLLRAHRCCAPKHALRTRLAPANHLVRMRAGQRASTHATTCLCYQRLYRLLPATRRTGAVIAGSSTRDLYVYSAWRLRRAATRYPTAHPMDGWRAHAPLATCACQPDHFRRCGGMPPPPPPTPLYRAPLTAIASAAALAHYHHRAVLRLSHRARCTTFCITFIYSLTGMPALRAARYCHTALPRRRALPLFPCVLPRLPTTLPAFTYHHRGCHAHSHTV